MGGDNTTEAVRRLGITHPIVQGPFGGGLSMTRLAATVSNMGGLGSFGVQGGQIAPNLRYRTAVEVMESLVGHSTRELPRE